METKDYSTKYFHDSLPEWKRKKDPILSRWFYRPVSFFLASVCARNGISANTVSYSSTVLAVVACVFFLVDMEWCRIVGAILCNVWLLMDCTDGNLARAVKKQPFGAFADSSSSYILVGFVCMAMGFACYHTGGAVFESGNEWVILLGAAAGSSDTMMRLVYQKYKATERELQDKGVMKVEYDARLDNNQVNNWRVRLEADYGIGGILPLLILLGTVFHALDIVVLYCLVYYGGSFVVTTFNLCCKAIKAQHKYQDRMPQ